MTNLLALIGDLLQIAETELEPSAERLAQAITFDDDEQTSKSFAAFEEAARCPGTAERIALLGAWIIEEQPFEERNLEIAYKFMRQLLEDEEIAWPGAEEEASRLLSMLKRLEDGEISVAKLGDWLRLRVATA